MNWKNKTMNNDSFPCDRCGLCCENLAGILLYEDLDDGTGVCKYFDKGSRLCSIYEDRPDKCNIDAAYIYFQDQMSYGEYIRLNIAACQKLKDQFWK